MASAESEQSQVQKLCEIFQINDPALFKNALRAKQSADAVVNEFYEIDEAKVGSPLLAPLGNANADFLQFREKYGGWNEELFSSNREGEEASNNTNPSRRPPSILTGNIIIIIQS
jgi:hypothetical protein